VPAGITPPAPGGSSAAGASSALDISPTAHEDAQLASSTNRTDSPPTADGASKTGALGILPDSAPATGAPTILSDGAATTGGGGEAQSTSPTAPTGGLGTPPGSSTPSSGAGSGNLAPTPGASTPSPGASAGGGGSSHAGGSGSWSHTAERTSGSERLHSADPGTHEKLWVADPTEGAADGGSGGPLENMSPPLSAALEDNPAASSPELGSAAYGVGLQEAIESLHGTIRLAAGQGLAQARILLQPEELGEIRINLTQTAQGLLARVSAESPAAAQALAAAHAQLRQSLSSLGLNLTRLDIGHHDPSSQSGGMDSKGNGQSRAARGEGSSESRPGRSARSPASAATAAPEIDSPMSAENAPSTITPLHGTLIDVLA
jgi:hypothetical protein